MMNVKAIILGRLIDAYAQLRNEELDGTGNRERTKGTIEALSICYSLLCIPGSVL